jgi:hypothetical protein
MVTRIGYLGKMVDVTCSVLLLLVNANVVPSSLFPFILILEAPCSSETSVLTRSTRGHIPEDGILHSHRCQDLRTYIALTG